MVWICSHIISREVRKSQFRCRVSYCRHWNKHVLVCFSFNSSSVCIYMYIYIWSFVYSHRYCLDLRHIPYRALLPSNFLPNCQQVSVLALTPEAQIPRGSRVEFHSSIPEKRQSIPQWTELSTDNRPLFVKKKKDSVLPNVAGTVDTGKIFSTACCYV